LSSGTCLGYFRENKFLDHDYDIDIGIFKEDYTPAIINKMAEKGLKLYRTLGSLETGLELSFRLNGTKIGKKAKIDIFLHYRYDDKIFWTSYMAPQFKKKIKYQVSNFVLKSVNFMDVIVNVPYPTVKYIREHYGQNWYIPIKTKGQGGSYDYRSSPKSIVKSED
jgi:phosphorylcholine metabolism protein LicD